MNAQIFLTVLAFLLTMIMIFWRPRGMNEAIPASIGAIIVILSGSVSLADLGKIGTTVTGAAITIMATIVMAIVLESFGFFNWVAIQLYNRSKGSGMRLFWNTNLLCFLMTLFFNNDGSILITTPILILLLNKLRLKPHQKVPYLLSGALIATASSAPIGVSNIVNLIALKIVHMTLYMHTAMMFVPGTIGLLFMATLLFLVLKKDIPEKLPVVYIKLDENYVITSAHPLKSEMDKDIEKAQSTFMKKILLFVFIVRCSLFVASYFGIPVEIVAVMGSFVLLGWRWYKLKLKPFDILVKTPWHILIFAFSMYVIVYGLHNLGFTKYIIDVLGPIVSSSIFNASLVMGFVLSVLSNIFNNHPALMIGTLTLTEMGLDPITVKTVYLANIIGSDIGSLLLPMGTLASLIWMHILKKSKIKMSWSKYMKVTFIVIPPTVLFTLTVLYFWVRFVFANHV
ncbi:arsenic transporter [Bacillus sp. RG28]|uniref:Arsenic transporter n=1 Tax=Gottfriedia endophytica TaxID=2820819 RepID=A0A940NFB7_9BACI|nr:arsenic transporter [Gottfriedia endophytica]MBP0724434.1 arsenic transporter [Gottfriedia endophytica]